ncbi:MAG: 50S ribosomal protein L15 [Halobacteriovoraceae bacterium]|nr:50S ribosomal protein L15 [Halobacteriovoraceae bacterium]
MTLNNLKSPKGSVRKNKRIGRGQGSGQGTQAGKGHKGQKARGGGGTRIGFEGGSMPLYMRLPKKGFSNAPFKEEFAEISLSKIEKKLDGEVTRELLIKSGLLKGQDKHRSIKVLANGELTKPLKFSGSIKFSKSAKELIEKAGGSIEE